MYCRYVDDIFLIVNNAHDVTYLKDKFETLFVLKFTFEIEARGRLTFLDIDVGSDLSTTVHVHSIAPESYKLGVIKTMKRRAYKISSSWYNFHVEVNRLKQLFTNNNFLINTIEREVKNFLDKTIHSSNHTTEELQDVKLYYCNQMSSNYKQKEKNLQKIITEHLTPAENKQMNLSIYYKNKKPQHIFMKNNIHGDCCQHHVVYRYECPEPGCGPSQQYIGYTVTSTKQRATTEN